MQCTPSTSPGQRMDGLQGRPSGAPDYDGTAAGEHARSPGSQGDAAGPRDGRAHQHQDNVGGGAINGTGGGVPFGYACVLVFDGT